MKKPVCPLLIKISLIGVGWMLSCSVQAEYYVSYAPAATYVECVSCQAFHKHSPARVKSHQKARVVHQRHSSCQMSVYYVYPPYWAVPTRERIKNPARWQPSYPEREGVYFMKPEDRIVSNSPGDEAYYAPALDTMTADNDIQ